MRDPIDHSEDSPDDEVQGSGWIGPLLLAVTPFLLFALLFFVDRLLR